jgi:hypothetical protein
MWKDPIVAEIRKIREEHAAKFNYNLLAIYNDIKEQEKKSTRIFVSYQPRYTQNIDVETPDGEEGK